MLGESTFIFYLTDGGPLVKCSAAEPKLKPVNQLPVAMSKLPGNEFFASAYRPDQRVIGWLLRPSGEVPEQTRSAETTIEAWLRINAAATGGRQNRACVSAMEILLAHTGMLITCDNFVAIRDSLTGMLFDRSLIGRSTWEGATIYQPSMGVTLRLDDEQMHVRENDSSQSSLVPMLIPDTIQPNGIVGSEGLLQWGHWPIPESAFFLLESTAPYYPRRPTAHSVIECSVTDIDWTARIPPGFPFKKFAFDNSHPLIQRLLTDGRDWICRVPLKMQGKTKISAPFGVIKANTAQTGLNLWLLPYDFPVLFELLEKHRSGGADLDWHRRMEGYLKAMPGYYRLVGWYCNVLKKSIHIHLTPHFP